MTRDELAKALQHRLDQMPHSLGFVLIPRDWLQEAVALLAVPARDQVSRDDGDRERGVEELEARLSKLAAVREGEDAETRYLLRQVFALAVDAITAVRASSPRQAQQEDQDQSRSDHPRVISTTDPRDGQQGNL